MPVCDMAIRCKWRDVDWMTRTGKLSPVPHRALRIAQDIVVMVMVNDVDSRMTRQKVKHKQNPWLFQAALDIILSHPVRRAVRLQPCRSGVVHGYYKPAHPHSLTFLESMP